VRYRLHPWLLLLALVAVCAAVVGVMAFLRYRATSTTADLIQRLPPGDAVVLYVDFDALRKTGLAELLDNSKTPEEPEYQAFVAQSGFDYRVDLDSALVAFRPDGTFLLMRGRFDWKTISGYVRNQGGACYNAFCRVGGSAPERNISFFPLRTGVMAMAVSKDDWAATALTKRHDGPSLEASHQPVWLSVPGSRLKDAADFPAGTRQFVRAIENAEKIVLSLGQRENRYEAVLDVTSRSAEDASLLLTHLDGITSFLKKMVAEEHKQANPGDLSGVLTSGVFERQGRRVIGRWPLERVFLESLASGSL
jgi:hypothetical protein